MQQAWEHHCQDVVMRIELNLLVWQSVLLLQACQEIKIQSSVEYKMKALCDLLVRCDMMFFLKAF